MKSTKRRGEGCAICIQRRVKCDLTQPVCNRCQKGDRACPGFSKGLKIRDEGDKIRKKYEESARGTTKVSKKTKSKSHAVLSQSREPSIPGHKQASSHQPLPAVSQHADSPKRAGLIPTQTNSSVSLTTSSSERAVSETVDMNSAWTSATRMVTFMSSPNLNQIQLLDSFVHAVGSVDREIVLCHNTRWLACLPPLTGENVLLDSAVRAVSLAYLGRTSVSEMLVNQARPYYSKALQHLSSSLRDKTESMSATTLCATILLSFYEMFMGDSKDTWIRHAGGAGALMRMRGASRHRSGLDREIFLSYRHNIIIEAMLNGEPCFLDEPEWKELSHSIWNDIHESDAYISSPQTLSRFDHAEEYFQTMASIPHLFRNAARLETVQPHANSDTQFIRELIESCKERRLRFKSIFARFRSSILITGRGITTHPCVDNDDVFPIFYQYANIFDALMMTGYWSVLVLLDTILLQYENDPQIEAMYRVESREAAIDCCMSTTFMLNSSFLGPFYILYCLRVTLAVFKPGSFEYDWVMRKFKEIARTKMWMAHYLSDIVQLDNNLALT